MQVTSSKDSHFLTLALLQLNYSLNYSAHWSRFCCMLWMGSPPVSCTVSLTEVNRIRVPRQSSTHSTSGFGVPSSRAMPTWLGTYRRQEYTVFHRTRESCTPYLWTALQELMSTQGSSWCTTFSKLHIKIICYQYSDEFTTGRLRFTLLSIHMPKDPGHLVGVSDYGSRFNLKASLKSSLARLFSRHLDPHHEMLCPMSYAGTILVRY